MSGKLNVSGTWKSVPAIYTKVAGTWRTVSSGYVKVAGVWKLWFLASITDSFTRATSAGNLGSTDTGNVWSILRGSWYSATGYATESATAGSSYPLAVVELGAANMIVSADISHDTGVVVWGVDANNWWAVVGTNYNYNYSYSTVCTDCGTCTACSSYTCAGACGNAVADTNNCCGYACIYACFGSCYAYDSYGGCIDFRYDCAYYCDCYGNSSPCGNAVADTNNCGCCSYSYTCCSTYACTQTGTAAQYQVKVLKSVAGTVTEVNSANVSSMANKISVTTSGTTLSYTAYNGTTSLGTYSAAQTSPNMGTKPGIIKGPATNQGLHSVDNFAASPN